MHATTTTFAQGSDDYALALPTSSLYLFTSSERDSLIDAWRFSVVSATTSTSSDYPTLFTFQVYNLAHYCHIYHQVVGPHRSRLHTRTMEALMCLQNWVIRGMKATKLESAYAIATIFDDSDSEGGATSEIIDPESECDFGFEER